MPNGKPGDNPVTDLVVWGIAQYDPEIDSLIKEISALLPPVAEVDEHGDPIDGPFDQEPLVDLIFAAEDDPARRPELRAELLALRKRLVGGANVRMW